MRVNFPDYQADHFLGEGQIFRYHYLCLANSFLTVLPIFNLDPMFAPTEKHENTNGNNS